jgi:hypothetical protein
LLATRAADGDAGLGRLVYALAFAGYRPQVVLFDVARALKESAPHLHVIEVYVFPEIPARVLNIEGTGAGEEQDGGWRRTPGEDRERV